MSVAPSVVAGVRTPTRREVPWPAVGALLAAVALLWIVPPVGLVAAVVAGWALAPWGERLGERLIVSAVVTAGGVGLLLAAAQMAGTTVPTLLWRVLASGALLAIAAVRATGRGARAWPRLGWEEGIALATAAVVAVAVGAPLLLVSEPAALAALQQGWDHSSHLPMFVQTMHARGWDMTLLGGGVMFDIYPMLHTGLWSVGEWVAGVAPQTPGVDLVRPYVAWSALTVALAALLLVLTAAVAAREFALRLRLVPGRRGSVSVLAAAFTAAWCLLGTLMLMADFAFTNFLLGAALAGAVVVVGARSVASLRTVGWFVLPLGLVAVAYAYPPLAGGVAVAAGLGLVALARARSRAALAMLAVGVLSGVAVLPAVRIVTEPFRGQSVGDIQGGIPAFELAAALVLAVLAVVGVLRLRPVAALSRAALVAPVLATLAVAALFAAQALHGGLALHDSYYTKKVLYAVLLLALPLAAALVAVPVSAWAAEGGTVRRARVLGAIAVAAAAVTGASVLLAGGRPGSDSPLGSFLPAGVWSAAQRVAWASGDPVPGLAVMDAAAVRPGWIAVTSLENHDVEAGRTAAGLGGVLTWLDNSVVEAAHRSPYELARMLRSEQGLRVLVVASDGARARAFMPLVTEFGSDRVEVTVVRTDS